MFEYYFAASSAEGRPVTSPSRRCLTLRVQPAREDRRWGRGRRSQPSSPADHGQPPADALVAAGSIRSSTWDPCPCRQWGSAARTAAEPSRGRGAARHPDRDRAWAVDGHLRSEGCSASRPAAAGYGSAAPSWGRMWWWRCCTGCGTPPRGIAVWLTLLLTGTQVQWLLIQQGRAPEVTEAQVHLFTILRLGAASPGRAPRAADPAPPLAPGDHSGSPAAAGAWSRARR
jgi:hypothetical protein